MRKFFAALVAVIAAATMLPKPAEANIWKDSPINCTGGYTATSYPSYSYTATFPGSNTPCKYFVDSNPYYLVDTINRPQDANHNYSAWLQFHIVPSWNNTANNPTYRPVSMPTGKVSKIQLTYYRPVGDFWNWRYGCEHPETIPYHAIVICDMGLNITEITPGTAGMALLDFTNNGYMRAGAIWFATEAPGLETHSQNIHSMSHEIGHTLGLSHEYNSNGQEDCPGLQSGYASIMATVAGCNRTTFSSEIWPNYNDNIYDMRRMYSM